MKIVKEYNNLHDDLIEIKYGVYVGNFAIHLVFNDGKECIVNFKSFIESSLHPSIQKYKDENIFRKFDIIDGNLNWNDYDLIFPLEDLYEAKL